MSTWESHFRALLRKRGYRADEWVIQWDSVHGEWALDGEGLEIVARTSGSVEREIMALPIVGPPDGDGRP
jgi:hypothetical protein